MSKTKTIALVQLIGLVLFGGMALSSASSKDTASSIDWRGAAVGAAAGYDGYIIIGTASSEAAAYKPRAKVTIIIYGILLTAKSTLNNC